jgi:NAD(P)H-hydrate repair Nnr-like enzyme with NAD(P)H-hydrate dehydratase domain
MSARTEAIEGAPKKWIRMAVDKLGVTILLKGSRTLVANENVLYELPRSTPWLATAGSGDVLAGIIGAIVATNAIEILNDVNRLAEVAATGALIHLLAADSASNGGPISAKQIISKISKTISQIF